MTDLVFFLIDTGRNDVAVYASSASLTGDLEVYEVDKGGLEGRRLAGPPPPLT